MHHRCHGKQQRHPELAIDQNQVLRFQLYSSIRSCMPRISLAWRCSLLSLICYGGLSKYHGSTVSILDAFLLSHRIEPKTAGKLENQLFLLVCWGNCQQENPSCPRLNRKAQELFHFILDFQMVQSPPILPWSMYFQPLSADSHFVDQDSGLPVQHISFHRMICLWCLCFSEI